MKKLHVEFDAIVSDRTYKELKEVSYVDIFVIAKT